MSKIICLWSCPRNISTALMYSFSQREDVCVFDEPLYAHYLKVTGVDHPGREAVLRSLNNNGDQVVQEVIIQKKEKILFHKLMTHFLIDINTQFLSLVNNVIFIRDPQEIISSYSKVILNPRMEDIGVKQQYQLYLDLENRGILPIVLNSKYLLQNPEIVLKKLCLLLEIPFNSKMLRWKKGSIKEDGIWAKYWYESVHSSTGFFPYKKKSIILDKNNKILAEECMPYYNFLNAKSIQL